MKRIVIISALGVFLVGAAVVGYYTIYAPWRKAQEIRQVLADGKNEEILDVRERLWKDWEQLGMFQESVLEETIRQLPETEDKSRLHNYIMLLADYFTFHEDVKLTPTQKEHIESATKRYNKFQEDSGWSFSKSEAEYGLGRFNTEQ